MGLLLVVLTVCLLWHACWLPARVAAGPWLRELEPLERLCVSFVLGAFGLYVAWLVGVLAGWGVGGRTTLVLASWGGLALRATLRGHGRALLPARDETRWAFLLTAIPVWMLLLASTQSTIYGGGWSGDWNEHYRRALFFLDRIPPGESLEFGVTDRPPLFNLVAAAWCARVGSRFSDYQVVHLTLSSMAAVPCLLLLARLTRRTFGGPRGFAFFLLAFLLQPTIVANTLYTWTRMFTVFFVLAAVYFYLRFDRDGHEGALRWSLLAASLGVVTHYSALVPAALLGAHLLWRRRGRLLARARLTAVGVSLLPPGLWAFWALRDFGWRATLVSNTTAQNYAQAGIGGVFAQWGYNFLTTVIPFWDRAAVGPYVLQASTAGRWSDALHLYWVSTLVGSVSTAVIVAVMAALLVDWLRTSRAAPVGGFRGEEARALVLACLAAFLLSFPTIPNREVSGFAHLALQPVVIVLWLIGVAWIVARGPGAQRLFLALYGAEGLLFYWLKTFDRTTIPASQLGFGYQINRRIQESHHLDLLFDREPGLAAFTRVALLGGLVALWLWCLAHPLEIEAGAGDAARGRGAAS